MNRPTLRQCLREKIRMVFGDRAEAVIEGAEESGDLERLVDDALEFITKTVDQNPTMQTVEAEDYGLRTFLDDVTGRIEALPVPNIPGIS